MKRNTTRLSSITWSKSKCAVSKRYLSIQKTNIMNVFMNVFKQTQFSTYLSICKYNHTIVVWITKHELQCVQSIKMIAKTKNKNNIDY